MQRDAAGRLEVAVDMDARRRNSEWDLPPTLVDSLFDVSPLGIILYDASGQTVKANESASRIAGKPVEELLSQNFHHIESWQHSGLLTAAKLALASGEAQRIEVHIRKSNGEEAWLIT